MSDQLYAPTSSYSSPYSTPISLESECAVQQWTWQTQTFAEFASSSNADQLPSSYAVATAWLCFPFVFINKCPHTPSTSIICHTSLHYLSNIYSYYVAMQSRACSEQTYTLWYVTYRSQAWLPLQITALSSPSRLRSILQLVLSRMWFANHIRFTLGIWWSRISGIVCGHVNMHCKPVYSKPFT